MDFTNILEGLAEKAAALCFIGRGITVRFAGNDERRG